MFCEEKIIAVYQVIPDDESSTPDAYLECYHGLDFYIPPEISIILETENHYLALRATGVCKYPKTDDFCKDKWWMPYITIVEEDEEEPPFVSYESTLFVGERLCSVEEKNGEFLLQFDDFLLRILPYALGDDVYPLGDSAPDFCHRVYGADRLLTRRCTCGGRGELLLDFVEDYFVRCRDCKVSTWSYMDAQDAIEEWNCGETPIISRDHYADNEE